MKIALVFLGALALSTAAPQPKATSRALIPDALIELGCTTLVDLVVQAGLAETLSGAGPFTVFAPTNEAFAALPQEILDALNADVALLQNVLLSHVFGGNVLSGDLSNDLTVASVSGAQLRVNLYANGPTVNGAPITVADAPADNGVIHVLSKVLFPLSTDVIPATLAADGRFSTLVTAVGVAGLGETLSGPGPFTLFAPTDDAFAALPEGVLDALLADPAALGQVLLGHAVSGTVYAFGVAPGDVPTLDGGSANINENPSGLHIDNAKIIETDIPATNGVVHVINAVI